MKLLKWIGISVLVLFLGLQAFSPSKTNPPIDPGRTIQANSQMPPEVLAILERSCSDCHTSNTRWPWYSYIAPVSWLVADDVKEARRRLQLSEWSTYPPKKAAKKLEDMCEEVKDGEMPLKSYLLLHPEARLSDADKQLLCDWAEQERPRVLAKQVNDSH